MPTALIKAQNVGFSSQVLVNRDLGILPNAVGSVGTQARSGNSTNLPKRETTSTVPANAVAMPEIATLTGHAFGRFGVLTDGAFSTALNSSAGAVPAVGALGINFLVLQPVTYSRSYRYIADARLGNTLSTATDSSLHLLPNNDTQLQTLFSLNAYGAFGSLGDTLSVEGGGGTPVRNQTAFGQTLLQPGVYTRGLRSAGLTAQYYPFHWWERKKILRNLGFTAGAVVTSTQWRYLKQRSSVVIWALSTGATYVVFNAPATSADDVSGRLEFYTNYTIRQIAGDVRDTPIILEQALGDVRRYWFHGLVFGTRLAVNSLRLSASYYKFGDHIEGFSNGQFILTVGFSGAIRFKDLTR